MGCKDAGIEPMFVLDIDGGVSRERFLSEYRKSGHKKYLLGKVTIEGSFAEIEVEEEKGGKIKIEDVKKHLRKYKITKAKYKGQGGGDSGPANETA